MLRILRSCSAFTANQVWSAGADYARGLIRLGAAYLNARTPNAGFFSNSSSTTITPATVALSSPVTTGFISAHSYSVAAASGVDSRDVNAVAAVNLLTPSSSNHAAAVRVGIRHKF